MQTQPRSLINSRLGIATALLIGRLIPSRLGYPLVKHVAKIIASRKDWEFVKAVRANQWVVSGGTLSSSELDQVVLETFRYTARSVYDFYHHMNDDPDKQTILEFEPRVQQLIEMGNHLQRGAVLTGLHMGNFDYGLQTACRGGFKPLVLGLAKITGGYQWQHEIRLKTGMELYPISLNSMRKAVAHLERGGVVVTGIDRPVPQPDSNTTLKYRPVFFGRASNTPVHHIMIALKARVPVHVAVAIQKDDGKYHFQVSDPIEMEDDTDHNKAIVTNAEKLLRVAEDYIRLTPRQWGMSYPVWPEAMGICP